MEENKLFHDRYFLERMLGRGNFSEVWLAKDTKTDIQVALKIYAPATGLDDMGLNVFAREFSLVVNANHKNLLKPIYYDSCERKPYLVLPFCREGSIMGKVGQFGEQDAWRLLRDVASGLAWLHGMNPPVIHQDIKPDNVMIADNGDFMITDFGVSTHLKSTLRKSMSAAFSSAGTIAYMAPERFGKDNTPIMANDVYSLGATVYEMLTGDTPFGDDGGLMQKKGADIPELQGEYSADLRKVVGQCLRTNPWERPTAEQLEHYAEAGLKGQPVLFAGEKSLMQKLRWPLVICVLALALIIVGVVLYQNKQDAQLEAERLEALRNDSIQQARAEAVRMISEADSLVSVGDVHDEGYEKAYMDAYSNYMLAGEIVAHNKAARAKIDSLVKKLSVAKEALNAKAEMFKDDPDIAKEFKERAEAIEMVLADGYKQNKGEK